MEYTFTLRYELADTGYDVEALVERLGDSGCTDALVGTGKPGVLVLEFIREAGDAETAMQTALFAVQRAIPSAVLVDAMPELINQGASS